MDSIIFESAMNEWWEHEESMIKREFGGARLIDVGGRKHKIFDAINLAKLTGKDIKMFGIPIRRN